MSRCYPHAYPNGSWPTGGSFTGLTANLASINANRKAITVSALPAGFKLSVGDYISITVGTRKDLHQVMEAATAAARHHDRNSRCGRISGLTSRSPRRSSVKQPACLMAIVPGSYQSDAQLNGWGACHFQAMEARL